jgi:hypothetical protein
LDPKYKSYEIIKKAEKKKKEKIKKKAKDPNWAGPSRPTDPPNRSSSSLSTYMFLYVYRNYGVNLPLLVPLIVAILYYRLKHENYSLTNYGPIQVIKASFNFLNL